MDPMKKLMHDEDIKLVEILGIILKWRKAVIAIVVSITLLAVVALSMKNFNRFNSQYSGEVKQDVLFASNTFFNKKTDVERYKQFVRSLLFPVDINIPKFEITVSNGLTLEYLFRSEQDKDLFMDKYNSSIDILYKLVKSRSNIKGVLIENCRKFFSTTQFSSPKDLYVFFDDLKDVKKCSEYNYYNGVVQDYFAHAFDPETAITITDTYLDFLSGFMEGHLESNKMITVKNNENKIKTSFNMVNTIKYSMVVFVLSVMIGIFFAFVLEFWSVNKQTISDYLK